MTAAPCSTEPSRGPRRRAIGSRFACAGRIRFRGLYGYTRTSGRQAFGALIEDVNRNGVIDAADGLVGRFRSRLSVFNSLSDPASGRFKADLSSGDFSISFQGDILGRGTLLNPTSLLG